MNYSKLILVGCISAFVAFTTSVMGVAGTIIGSVISSVLYNMLSEALEKPVNEATFSSDFEWEIAYVFPLAVIALIQILFILALFSEMGYLPYTFLKAYLSLQGVAGNNLYRVLGVSLIVMSVYPFILKPDFINKAHGAIIAFVGLIFLARGFVDYESVITNLYDEIFVNFDLPIAIIALILLLFVINKILLSAKRSEKEFKVIKHGGSDEEIKKSSPHKTSHSKKPNDFKEVNTNQKPKKFEPVPVKPKGHKVKFRSNVESKTPDLEINTSSDNIHFESNDLLDDYKK